MMLHDSNNVIDRLYDNGFGVPASKLNILKILQNKCQTGWFTYSQKRSQVGWGGAIASPIGLSTKMQNQKSTMFLALLRLFFALELTKQLFKASFETYSGGGLIVKN